MYIRGLKVSRAQRRASSALAASSSAAMASGSKPRASTACSGGALGAATAESCRIPFRPLPFGPGLVPFWAAPALSVAVGSIKGLLDRALALAALDLVGLGAAPVDEVEQILGVELDRQLQVGDQLLELLGSGAVGEGVEVLAVVPLLLVVADPALARIGNALCGEPRLQPVTEGDVAALEAAGDMRDVGGNRLLADLDRGAVEAD